MSENEENMCVSCGRNNWRHNSKPSENWVSKQNFLFWYWLWPKTFFFRNKTFLFFKIESWNFQHLFENGMKFNKFQLNRKNENNNCLNELNEMKFCEASWNSISNRCWKFQLSILKNKKVLFLKKNVFLGLSFSACQERSKRWRLLS